MQKCRFHVGQVVRPVKEYTNYFKVQWGYVPDRLKIREIIPPCSYRDDWLVRFEATGPGVFQYRVEAMEVPW